MKQNKGFTLIELLAVIVILAIIALIATPIVLNMIANARKSAAKSSTLGYVDSIEYYAGFAQANVDGIDLDGYSANKLVKGTCVIGNGNDACNAFVSEVSKKHKGAAPKSGSFTLDESGRVTVAYFEYNDQKCKYDGTDANCKDAEWAPASDSNAVLVNPTTTTTTPSATGSETTNP